MSIEQKEPKIIYLDATAFKEALCLRKLAYLIIEGLRPKKEESWFAFGNAIHKFVAHLRTTKDYAGALCKALDFYRPTSERLDDKDFRTLSVLNETCILYYSKVFRNDLFQPILDTKGNTLIEQKFAFPATDIFPEIAPLCKQLNIVIMLSGTVDEIGIQGGNDEITIKDIKTSTSFYVKEYFENYNLSIQMMFYIMVVEHKLKIKDLGVIIDGIFFHRNGKNININFARSETIYYSDKQKEFFKRQLKLTIDGIILAYQESLYPENYLACDREKFGSQEKVGKCQFFQLCSSTDDEIRQFRKTRDFKTIEYNPLKFDEMRD
jgi:hypothetical protein